MATILIRNIIKNCEFIGDSAREIVNKSDAPEQINLESEQVLRLWQDIRDLRTNIERVARKKGGDPADLPNPSFQAYQWIKYLSSKKRLLVHLHGLFEFVALSSSKQADKKHHAEHIHFDLKNSSHLFRSRNKSGGLSIEINEGFVNAPMEIKNAIIQASFGDKRRTLARKIRTYAKSTPYQKVLRDLRNVNTINQLSSKGKVYDLAVIFHINNKKYFENSLSQPRLIWSARRSKRRLGMFDPESGTITINRILDSKEVPQIALEYILFHEMLHKKMGIIESNGRRYAHTPIFKSAEKQFRERASAEDYIKKMLRKRN